MRPSKKLLRIIAGLGVATLLLTGCGSTGSGTGGTPAAASGGGNLPSWCGPKKATLGLTDGFGATSLAGGQVGGFESQGVVFVFGDVFFVSRRFMGRPHCLFGLQQVFGEPLQHLLLQQEFIHDER